MIGIDGKRYLAHRLAWFYVTGYWPELIDHVDGNRSNNAWSNLREANKLINQQNRHNESSFNETGLLGAFRVGGRFKSSIRYGGKSHHLGYFDTAEQAHAAYVSAKREHHVGCAI